MVKSGSTLYRLNLIRATREREKKSERKRRLAFILGAGCFGFFAISVMYSALTIWQMEHILTQEKDKLSRLQLEYNKYTATKLIVDKADIELLGGLPGKGIFWTRKLAAMAKHLPENYWITGFGFSNNELKVSGFGFANAQQEQLLVLDEYVNHLKRDTTFSDTFTRMKLNFATRSGESGRIAFEFSAYTSAWKSQ